MPTDAHIHADSVIQTLFESRKRDVFDLSDILSPRLLDAALRAEPSKISFPLEEITPGNCRQHPGTFAVVIIQYPTFTFPRFIPISEKVDFFANIDHTQSYEFTLSAYLVSSRAVTRIREYLQRALDRKYHGHDACRLKQDESPDTIFCFPFFAGEVLSSIYISQEPIPILS